MSDAIDQKRMLRDHARSVRADMTPEALARTSSRIRERMRSLPEVAGASALHTFLPSLSLREIDVMPLVDDLAGRGVRIVVPVVQSFSRDTGGSRLLHCIYTPGMELHVNRWGIPEPVERIPAGPLRLNVIVVPALACDVHGYRLGQGYGYYDELLGQIDAVSVCPCPEALLYTSLPREEHDRPVDIIVTELTVLRQPGSPADL